MKQKSYKYFLEFVLIEKCFYYFCGSKCLKTINLLFQLFIKTKMTNVNIFSEAAFKKRLIDLTPTAQSIQSLSKWLIGHRKHVKLIVQAWQTQLINIKSKKKLNFLYLANDVMQNSRRNGSEFIKAFGAVMITACTHVARSSDKKTVDSVNRMLNIWLERKIYDAKFITNIKTAIRNMRHKVENNLLTPKTPNTPKTPSTPKSSSKMTAEKRKKIKQVNASVTPATPNVNTPNVNTPAEEPLLKKSKLQKLIEETENDDYLSVESTSTPSIEDLIKTISSLENPPSSKADKRHQISSFPITLQQIDYIQKITDRSEASKLSKQANTAVKMLSEYNAELTNEMTTRRKLARMLSDYTTSQKSIIKEIESTIVELQGLLETYQTGSKHLKDHIKSLPDMSKLKSEANQMPLPDPVDMFV